MGDPKGFMNTGREVPKRRPVDAKIGAKSTSLRVLSTYKSKLADAWTAEFLSVTTDVH